MGQEIERPSPEYTLTDYAAMAQASSDSQLLAQLADRPSQVHSTGIGLPAGLALQLTQSQTLSSRPVDPEPESPVLRCCWLAG